MAESVTLFLKEYLSPEIVVFLISMLPILELRGSLVAASLLGVPWGTATLLSILGNMLPVPFILLFVRPVLTFMQKRGPFKRLANFLINKAHTKGAEVMEKYPRQLQLALFLFVAIPLPGTGAWTGSLIAAFLGIRLEKALPPVYLGILGASVIMLCISYVIPALLGLK